MKALEENKYYIWLSSIREINTRTKAILLQEYKSPKNLFYKSKSDLTMEIANNKKIDKENKKNVIDAITNEYYKSRLEKNIIKNKKMRYIGINI